MVLNELASYMPRICATSMPACLRGMPLLSPARTALLESGAPTVDRHLLQVGHATARLFARLSASSAGPRELDVAQWALGLRHRLRGGYRRPDADRLGRHYRGAVRARDLSQRNRQHRPLPRDVVS